MIGRVWKFALSQCVGLRCAVPMPTGSTILSAGLDPQGRPSVWALVDPEVPTFTERTFIVYGTGHAITEPERLAFVGRLDDGAYVWHVFEVVA